MPQQIDRLLISRGPAMITYRGGVFFSKEDITVDLAKSTDTAQSSAFGPLTEFNLGVKATMKFTPVGEFEHLDVLWPYSSTPIGRSIFGADADYPILIQPLDDGQKQVTFWAGGVSQMPDLNFTAKGTLIGEVGFQMVGKNNTLVDDANRLFTFAANTIDLDALPYDPTKLLIQAYENRWLSAGTFTNTVGANTSGALAYNISAADLATALNALASVTAAGGVTVTGSLAEGWTITAVEDNAPIAITGAVTGMPAGTTVRVDVLQPSAADKPQIVKMRLFPWHNFAARDGVQVKFSTTVTEDDSDAIGQYDSVFGGLSVELTAQPQGFDLETMLSAAAVQGAASVRGRKLSTGAHDFIVTGEGVYFALYGANLKGSGAVFGAINQRVPAHTWAGSRSIRAGGAINPLFYIGADAPA